MVFSPDLGGKNGGVLTMRMRVILDSLFARPGSALVRGGRRGGFREWTTNQPRARFSISGEYEPWNTLRLQRCDFRLGSDQIDIPEGQIFWLRSAVMIALYLGVTQFWRVLTGLSMN